jgi:hypothetical protein
MQGSPAGGVAYDDRRRAAARCRDAVRGWTPPARTTGGSALVDEAYGRRQAVVGWCLAAVGIIMVMVSAVVSSDSVNLLLQISGLALFTVGSAVFTLGQLRH